MPEQAIRTNRPMIVRPAPGRRRRACFPAALAAAMLSLIALPLGGKGPSVSASDAEQGFKGGAAELVAKLGDRLASYPKLESWKARARSTNSHMTSDWKPKKTTTTEKIVTVDGKLWSEEILRATETEDGRTRDITDKVRSEARERAERQGRPADAERKDDQRSRGRRNFNMTRDEVLPFSPERRSGYDFTVKGPADLDGAPVIALQSRSRVRSEEKFEGLYYIDPETFDVLRAELTVAKKPGPLKRLEMEIDFLVLPEGYQVMKKAVMRIHVGLVVKNVRIEAVETYSDHTIRGHDTHSPFSPESRPLFIALHDML